MSSSERLYGLLSSLPANKFSNEAELAARLVPELVSSLGYAESETFYDYAIDRYRADVVLAGSISVRPWCVIELKNRRPKNPSDWVYQLKRNMEPVNCKLGFVISPTTLAIVKGDGLQIFDLDKITPQEVEGIYRAFCRNVQPNAKELGQNSISEAERLLEKVESSESNKDKGDSLEELAKFLFKSIPSLMCKYSNLYSRSSEIDLVIEYDRTKGWLPLFEEIGRYCLVECKNWNKPVGVSPVRDFMGKLDKCKVKLGIILSKNGVTGVDSGADALREIQSRYDRDGVQVLVFSLEDLKKIKSSEMFYSALDKKSDRLRFDADGC